MAGQLTRRESEMRPWREFGPLDTFRREMDQFLSRFFGTEEGLLEMGAPSIDLSETDGEIEVRMDAPGVKAQEIDIRLEGRNLIVQGEHAEEKEEKDGRRFHRIERRSGRFSRSIQLPTAVQEDKIEAELKDGVLTLKMPKAEESRPHKIPVKG